MDETTYVAPQVHSLDRQGSAIRMTTGVVSNVARWMIIAWIVCGVILAQFSIPRDYIHRSFPRGHVGWPGFFFMIEYHGWPFVFRTEGHRPFEEDGIELSGFKLTVDIAVCLFIVLSSIAVLHRLSVRFTLLTLIEAVLAVALYLATCRLVAIPFAWYTRIPIHLGILCFTFAVAHGLTAFSDFTKQRTAPSRPIS